MMDLHRRPDGLLEIRTSLADFSREWAVAGPENKLVLDTPGELRRPAVWTSRENKTVLTPYPALWEEWRRAKARGGVQIGSRERQCRVCGGKLTLHVEYTDVWTFFCEVCRSVEAMGKDEVGGTRGAGIEEKT